MTRFHSLTCMTILMLCTSPLAPAAVALPPAPEETPAERAFRLAGFTHTNAGCRLPSIVFAASPGVGDAQMQGLVDPGFQFILDLSKSHVSDAGMKAVTRFSRLSQLNVTGSGISLAGLAELDNSRPLYVELDASQITADAARYLAAHAKPTCTLNVTPLNDAVFHVLGEAHLLHLLAGVRGKDSSPPESDQAIDSMVLQSKEITDASMKDVAGLTNLTSLYLAHSGVTDGGMKELAAMHHLSRIDLTYTQVTDAALENIAALENLKWLGIYQTAITGSGLKHLASHAGLCLAISETQLIPQVLGDIARNGIPTWTLRTDCSDRSVHILREAGMLHLLSIASGRDESRPQSADDVVFLRIRGRQFTEAGFKELAVFKNLQTLDLGSSRANDATMVWLATLDRLTSLDLSRTAITDAGLKLLAKKTNLTKLNVSRTQVTEAGVRELQLALPGCAIEHDVPGTDE